MTPGTDPSRATIRLRFATEAEARTVQAAIEPDNEGHLETRVEDDTLILEAASSSHMGLLRTLDDALGCIRALGHE